MTKLLATNDLHSKGLQQIIGMGAEFISAQKPFLKLNWRRKARNTKAGRNLLK